jgi:hypothetical protein
MLSIDQFLRFISVPAGGIPDRVPGFGRENFSLLTLRISRANSSPADPAPDLPVQAVDFPVYLRLM